MTDITAIGEVLIDLTQSGVTDQGIPRFDANPGGAPANLAVAAARLGAKTAFVGRVGSDSFGQVLLTDTQPGRIQAIFDELPNLEHSLFQVSNGSVNNS